MCIDFLGVFLDKENGWNKWTLKEINTEKGKIYKQMKWN